MKRGKVVDSFTVTQPDVTGSFREFTFKLHENGNVYYGRYRYLGVNTVNWLQFKNQTIAESDRTAETVSLTQ